MTSTPEPPEGPFEVVETSPGEATYVPLAEPEVSQLDQEQDAWSEQARQPDEPGAEGR